MRDLEGSKSDELLTMLEELQDENESLQDQISEAQQTISQLSYENSVMKSELQKKSETIVALNEQIEKLNGSDLVLQQNEQLRKENSELQRNVQKVRESATAQVSAIKREYIAKGQELEDQIRQATRREQFAREMIVSYEEKVSEEAQRISEKARTSAKREYLAKRDAVYGVTMGSLLYGFFATILTACNSPRLIKDSSAFLAVMRQLVTEPVLLIADGCEVIWTVKDMIPYPVLDVAAAGILVILTVALSFGLIYGLTGFAIYQVAKFYHKEFWDLISAIVALVSMGILVWFADTLTVINYNLILVWMLIHCTYFLIRTILTNRKKERD